MKALKSRINRWMKSLFQYGSFHLLYLALATGCGPSGSSEQNGSDLGSDKEEVSSESQQVEEDSSASEVESSQASDESTLEAAVNAIKNARGSDSFVDEQVAENQPRQAEVQSTTTSTVAAQSNQSQQQQTSAKQTSGGQSSFPGMSKPAITQDEYRTLFEGIKSDLEAGEIDAAIAKAGIIAERNLSPAQLEALKQIALPVRAAQNALRKAETGSQKMTPQALETLKKELATEALEKLKGVTL